jgi:carbamoyltransferase
VATFVGISTGSMDPAVAVVRDGSVLAYVEEERLLRDKHAPYRYPWRALRWALSQAMVAPEEVAAIAVPWDTEAFADGRVGAFYESMAARYAVDEGTRGWQRAKLRQYATPAVDALHRRAFRRAFGTDDPPSVIGVPHHLAHAVQAGLQSPYAESVVLTADGSGDTECSVLWEQRGDRLKVLRQLHMPHSLGWFYAAVTEYLGFDAYDEEYKVMGLAAYGTPDPDLSERVRRVLGPSEDGVGYQVDPSFIHYGRHSHSGRFTDALGELLGRPPRPVGGALSQWHRDVAYAAQRETEDAICRLVGWAVKATGITSVSLGGGVAANVVANGAILERTGAQRVFAHPLCGDAGAAAGAALALSHREGYAPEVLSHVALGPDADRAAIEAELHRAGCPYTVVEDIAAEVAAALAAGEIVGWFDGRLEGGARALGQRSILADPRAVEARDRVNAAVKMREPWRPFCPSLPAEAAGRYLVGGGDHRFMTVACRATDRLRADAPAVVHVDGTVRPQVVDAVTLPRFHRVLTSFERLSGVPVVLNTSFNLAGEPIVASPRDALRTFWSSGLSLLAMGDIVVRKPA